MAHRPKPLCARALLLSTVVGVALLAPAAAPAAEPQPLAEADFVARVQASDPRFELYAARVDESRAEARDARRIENPTIAYDREEVFGDAGGFADQFLRVAWPIDLSGRRGRRAGAAQRGVEASEAEAAFDGFLLVLDALEVYYDAAHARLRVHLLRESREELVRLVEVVRTRKSAGDASGYDLDRLELELGAHDDLLAGAEAELAGARRRVAALAGEPEALFDASDPLDLPALPADLDELVQGAARGRPDHRAATLRADQADRELAAARRSWIPELVLTGGWKSSDLGDETAQGYVVGLVVELPLFDRGQGDQARSAARKRQWQAAARTIERDAAAAIRIAWEELALRIDQAKRYEETQVARVADLLRRAETAYREGDRPLFELLDAHRLAREVRLRRLEHRRDAKQAQLALWRAQGHR